MEVVICRNVLDVALDVSESATAMTTNSFDGISASSS